MGFFIQLDKAISPYLFKAIDAAKNSELVLARKYDIENFYILFEDVIHKKDGKEYYTINFYAKEVSQDNWMDVSPHDIGGVNVDIDINTKEVIYIYGDR
ncbi:hypothetical protein EXT68_22600 [Pectobacterium parmentieri]|uniref:Uncharacterized protein n=1 Tax=Pectobacterium parmentieri TaxID=1905730 RepID=A0A0H3HWU0_PECPM|nr:hypothetical protein [Pectobacterium parmentieri]AFI88291.1 Hypothetical protein W5S_0152 [Pectobacterium parmentieri]MBI0473324.1 hypothetical protein [Pectobacterium parmentieri]MBI0495941.1 hypothetical protein [Pectobacterium parmentieri]MBI0557362.1 hypothetical protein [Pectobacterium parmentieri]MBI0570490.1 hypothetical protein [Pectobacterium parmentieri]